ncbi:MAG: MATE family efflux transporter [Rikenellaceae bacterium]|nr:MATE family efflux transporter [Rikenellaceae bacterium]
MKDFTTGNETRLILNFAIPMILGNVFMQLYQFVDSIIVGQYLGKEALAAVGASTPVIFMIISLIMGIGVGASVVVSQYFGAKEYEKVRATCDTIFVFLFVAGVAVTVLGTLFSRNILALMGLPDDVLPHATEYLRIYFLGSILLFGYNAVSAMLRGVGDSKTPLYFLIVASVLNVGLDLFFILVLDWGVAGAAWATIISQGMSFLLCVVYVNWKGEVIRVRFSRKGFDWAIFRQCVRLGLPTGLQQMFVGAGNTAMMSIVSGFGTNVIAAYTAASRIDMFASLPIMNFSGALTSFVGQNISVGRFDRIKAGLRSTLLMSVACCVFINLSIIVFARPLIGIFTSDPAVIDYGRQTLIIMNSFYFIFAVMFTFNGALRGAGAAVVPMLTTLLSLWIIRVPAAAIFSRWFGEVGIWWAVPVGWFPGALCAIGYYLSGRWKNKSVVFKGD